MLAEFFLRKSIRHFAVIVCVVFVLYCVGYAFLLTGAKQVAFEMNSYFLVKQGVEVEAGAEFTRWEGGAGYLIEQDGTQYATINVFFDKVGAESVRNRLSENGQDCSIVSQEIHKLYFKGNEKENSEKYVGALKLLKSYILLLNDCITRLEDGLTQEACKRVLKTLAAQYEYTSEVYVEYSGFNEVCKQSAEELQSICRGTVYLKDLRYLLCYQTDNFLKLCSAFSI